MTKTKKNSLFLVVIALLLAALSAALIFTVAPKRVNAEEEKAKENVVIEKTEKEKQKEELWELIKELQKEPTIGNTIKSSPSETLDYSSFVKTTADGTFGGKIIAVESGVSGLFMARGTITQSIYSFQIILMVGGAAYEGDSIRIQDPGNSANNLEIELTRLTNEERAAFMSEEDYSTLTIAEYIPSSITYNGEVINLEEFVFSSYEGIDPGVMDEHWQPTPIEYAIYEPDNSSTSTEPTEPGENPGETPTESDTNDKKPFDLGEWLANAGNDVSAWLGDNVGIATSGSTVLIVGAVIIVIVIARRRRR